ncbi:35-cyclic-nucleotide phosphodiesterase (PDEase) (3:5-CNP) [Glugoides intestinalis]
MNNVHNLELTHPIEVYDKNNDHSSKRSLPAIPAVACHKIPDIAILDQKAKYVDLNVVKVHFLNEGKLSVRQIQKIVHDANVILKSEPNLLELNEKCFIIGDVHGQLYDLLSLIDSFDLSKDTLLFLGDYVDRGAFGVEAYLYLLLLKTHYPRNIFILRGNHECEKMTTYFSFKAECIFKYNVNIYKLFVNSFMHLPIAAVVQNTAFCCHGGISPSLKGIFDLNLINRFKEIEYKGIFCDLFWADPHEYYDIGMGVSWEFNHKRNCSVMYTYKDVKSFLDYNNLSMVIRAHEVQETGYKLFKNYNEAPSVVTIFSAPGYCDTYQNDGAYIEFDMGIVSIRQFKGVDHPFVLNGFIDGISWSLPFIGEKLLELSISLFKALDEEELLDSPENLVSKMAIARMEREAIDEFEKEEYPECKVLSVIENEITFKEAEAMDANNEMEKSRVECVGDTPSLQNKKLEALKESVKESELCNIIQNTAPAEKSSVAAPKEKTGGICRYLCGR